MDQEQFSICDYCLFFHSNKSCKRSQDELISIRKVRFDQFTADECFLFQVNFICSRVAHHTKIPVIIQSHI